jgi:hypothetical protein
MPPTVISEVGDHPVIYELNIIDGCNTIQLSRGMNCLISSEDYGWISRSKWHAGEACGGRKFYATRNAARGDAGTRKPKLHVEILRRQGPRPDGCPWGLHRDDDALNRTRSNLAWGDATTNVRVAQRNGTSRCLARGEGNPNAKVTEPDVVRIRQQVAAGRTKASVAREFGVSRATVRFIAVGATWRHVGGPISA